MSHKFNRTILREYDIRGIVGDTLTEADAYALGRTYAALARDEGAKRILDVDGGIQVTGSHNPSDYNGFKLLLKGRSVFGQEIQALGRRAAAGDWTEGEGAIEMASTYGVFSRFGARSRP